MKRLIGVLIVLSGIAQVSAQAAPLSAIVNGLDKEEFSEFVAAFNKSGLSSTMVSDELFVVAPTNDAWNSVPSAAISDMFSEGNKETLDGVVGCHVVNDVGWAAAIASITANKEGYYKAPTLGGCEVAAYWSGTGVKVTSDFGETSPLLASSAGAGYDSVETVFFPKGTNLDGVVRASRIFAGPTQFPPRDYAAYGLLIFRAPVDENTRKRQAWLCDVYVNTIQHTSKATVPAAEQMVTVWPVVDDRKAKALNSTRREEVCGPALSSYDYSLAQSRLEMARAAGASMGDRGPLLVAWSPPSSMGGADAIVLAFDLSNVTTPQNAQNAFQFWIDHIEQKPEVWSRGFDVERLRLELQFFADRSGEVVAQIIGGT